MKVQYEPGSDMLYIRLSDGVSTESQEVAAGIVLDFDVDGRVLGIEIEDAGKLIDLTRLDVSALPVTQLILTKDARAVA
ncbi:MAG: DUF2283 domain-containing protein [Anaerolineae bacterium]